jgi:hypothetical protein
MWWRVQSMRLLMTYPSPTSFLNSQTTIPTVQCIYTEPQDWTWAAVARSHWMHLGCSQYLLSAWDRECWPGCGWLFMFQRFTALSITYVRDLTTRWSRNWFSYYLSRMGVVAMHRYLGIRACVLPDTWRGQNAVLPTKLQVLACCLTPEGTNCKVILNENLQQCYQQNYKFFHCLMESIVTRNECDFAILVDIFT